MYTVSTFYVLPAVIVLMTLSCSSCSSDDLKRGVNESCAKTDECEAGLQCLDFVCRGSNTEQESRLDIAARDQTAAPTDDTSADIPGEEDLRTSEDLPASDDGATWGEDAAAEVCMPVCFAETGAPLECGWDGCGGVCGECPFGEPYSCENNTCICTPNCNGKECGADLCGGSCGECASGLQCASDSCCHEPCPEPVFADTVLKISHLNVGETGLPGVSLDVDDDVNTCAPETLCAEGLDNSMGTLWDALFDHEELQAALEQYLVDRTLLVLAEMVEVSFDGSEFPMNIYSGELVDEACDHMHSNCEYEVAEGSFDTAMCLPLNTFDNARISGSDFTAGGQGYPLTLALPIEPGVALVVNAQDVRIQGGLAVEDGRVTRMDAVIGGVIPKLSILDAVEALPDDPGGSFNKDVLRNKLKLFLVVDVDLNHDGELNYEDDGVSFGVSFSAIQGTITGVSD